MSSCTLPLICNVINHYLYMKSFFHLSNSFRYQESDCVFFSSFDRPTSFLEEERLAFPLSASLVFPSPNSVVSMCLASPRKWGSCNSRRCNSWKTQKENSKKYLNKLTKQTNEQNRMRDTEIRNELTVTRGKRERITGDRRGRVWLGNRCKWPRDMKDRVGSDWGHEGMGQAGESNGGKLGQL